MDAFEFEVEKLANRLDGLNRRMQAAAFAVLARALLPLAAVPPMRDAWDTSAVEEAVDRATGFACDSVTPDNGQLLERLRESTPHGDEMDAPESSYAQAISICADAALRAALPAHEVKGIWLEYSLDPLLSSLCERDLGVVDIGSSTAELEWRSRISMDPAMRDALDFINAVLMSLSGKGAVSRAELERLHSLGRVLLPIS